MNGTNSNVGLFGEMSRLFEMLLDAQIPFQHVVELAPGPEEYITTCVELYREAGKYLKNQIIYYRPDGSRVFDVICQGGSYGCECGLLESYGDLGCDSRGEPRIITADEAFKIIKTDWDNCRRQESDSEMTVK